MNKAILLSSQYDSREKSDKIIDQAPENKGNAGSQETIVLPGGQVFVKSTINAGSTFIVELQSASKKYPKVHFLTPEAA